jgi:hypothetical protein
MAYQDVKRAKTAISLTPWATDDQKIGVILQEHQQLAQEVVECHNRVQVFAQTLTGVGITTKAVTLPAPARDSSYFVGVMFAANAGANWVTARTTTGFTLTWATALTDPVVTFLIVN